MTTMRLSFAAAMLALVATLTLALPMARAQGEPTHRDGRRLVLLVLPVYPAGDFRPLDAAGVLAPLRTQLTAQAPTVRLIVARAGDPRNRGLEIHEPISDTEALVLARAYRADLVAWGSLRWVRSRDYQNGGSGSGSTTATSRAAVWGQAQVRLLDGVTGRVLLDQPMLHVNGERSGEPPGSDVLLADERRAAERCAGQVWEDVVRVVSARAAELQAAPSEP